MIQFIKDSVRELKHVVWPTKKETGNFFILVLTILTLFWIYLFIFSNVFSTIVFGLKDLVRGESISNTEAVDTSFLDDISITSSGETLDVAEEEPFSDTEEEISTDLWDAETPTEEASDVELAE